MTEVGFESANHGVQIFGGHGFIAEHGMEQNVRDSRISMLYEGTTGVQALDLLGRKVLMTQGEALKGFTKIDQYRRSRRRCSRCTFFAWRFTAAAALRLRSAVGFS